MTRVLITGATGWLGGHILEALVGRDEVEPIAATRDRSRLPEWFTGEVREGDLTDSAYRRDVVQGVDVVIHAGTWSSFWGHADAERLLFLEPCVDLIDRSVEAGVKRFISASTVALGTPATEGARVPDDDPPVKHGVWPHHDAMVEIENVMRERAGATSMVSLRLGHFIGRGADLGLVSALVPRLRTRQVPWVNGGRAHLPLVAGEDLGEAFALAAESQRLGAFESIAVIGSEQPTAREAFTFIANYAGVPKPAYSVPTGLAYRFAGAMEAIHRFTPAKAPFLTRALVHVGENWHMEASAAQELLGYVPRVPWRDAIAADIDARRAFGFPWPQLAQRVTVPVSTAPRRAPVVEANGTRLA